MAFCGVSDDRVMRCLLFAIWVFSLCSPLVTIVFALVFYDFFSSIPEFPIAEALPFTVEIFSRVLS